ncbi:MAG: class I SAM-dependent methyltransferase [Sphingomonadales bacterium]
MAGIPASGSEHRAGFWHALGAQLGNPSGIAGRIVGGAMRLANRTPNALAVEALGVRPEHVVLDLGCGPGQSVRMIAAQVSAGRVHGLDRSPLMLRQAAKANRSSVRAKRVVLAEGRFEQLPYADRTFDRILASNVMYFWNDAAAVVRELRRVLRPGGRIVIYVTDASAMREWRFARTGTHRLFDAAGLARTLWEAGMGADELTVSQVRVWRRIPGLLAVISPKQ